MALQINKTLTTKSGFAVASGSYCWLQEEKAVDNKYSVLVRLVLFKDKSSFDQGLERISVNDIPDNKTSFYQIFDASSYANLTSMTIHNYVKAQLEATLGNNTVTIVQ